MKRPISTFLMTAPSSLMMAPGNAKVGLRKFRGGFLCYRAYLCPRTYCPSYHVSGRWACGSSKFYPLWQLRAGPSLVGPPLGASPPLGGGLRGAPPPAPQNTPLVGFMALAFFSLTIKKLEPLAPMTGSPCGYTLLYYIGGDETVWKLVCCPVAGCAVCGVCRGWGRDTYGNAVFTLF